MFGRAHVRSPLHRCSGFYFLTFYPRLHITDQTLNLNFVKSSVKGKEILVANGKSATGFHACCGDRKPKQVYLKGQ